MTWLGRLLSGDGMAVPLKRIYGFPVYFGYRFEVCERRYRLGTRGLRTLRLLVEILEHAPLDPSPYWLVPLRSSIRQIRQINATAALVLVAEQSHNQRLRHLAVWLRGRCGGTLGTPVIAGFSDSSDEGFRKDVVRCLQRLSAWAALDRISSVEGNPRIRRHALQVPPKPFAGRLQRFSEHAAPLSGSDRRQEMRLASGLNFDEGKPPKRDVFIQGILHRIRRLVTQSLMHK